MQTLLVSDVCIVKVKRSKGAKSVTQNWSQVNQCEQGLNNAFFIALKNLSHFETLVF